MLSLCGDRTGSLPSAGSLASKSAPQPKVSQEQCGKTTGLDHLQGACSEEGKDKERKNLKGREVE